MTIELLNQESPYLKEAIAYFWNQWGSESNYDFYRDCIENSLATEISLPKFYVLLDQDNIVGSYALLTNDIISRQDLMPWFACLLIDDDYRKQGLAQKLLNHGLDQARQKGYDYLYLSTDLIGFYEKKGWDYYAKAFGLSGDEFNVYSKSTH